ncbi:MAG: PaaI family thioesterase [Oscillospiraceae bacterium]|jgi:acyl-CoA thioesterase|nr:PaaI family thioesterase [Oscillospiraceae bacterium]
MAFEYDINRVREFFSNDRFAALAGVSIESVTDSEVICSLGIDDRHLNAMGGVQGGAIFTLADLCFAIHCNQALIRGEQTGGTVGQSCSISFLKAPRGQKLTARSRRLSAGRTMSVFAISVYDGFGNYAAEMLGNAFTTAKRPRAEDA